MADSFTLNPDGTATIVIGDNPITLKVPTLEEYGDLIDILDEGRFKTLQLYQQASKVRATITTVPEAETEEVWRQAKSKEREAEEIRANFIIAALERLGGAAVERGKLPRWTASNDLITKLTNHWETVPFPGSAQPT